MDRKSAVSAVEQCLADAAEFRCSGEADERMWCSPQFLTPIDKERMRQALGGALQKLREHKPKLDESKPWEGISFELAGLSVSAPGVSFYLLSRWLAQAGQPS